MIEKTSNSVTASYVRSRQGDRGMALLIALAEASRNVDFDDCPAWTLRVVDAPTLDKLRRFGSVTVQWDQA